MMNPAQIPASLFFEISTVSLRMMRGQRGESETVSQQRNECAR